MNSILNHYGDLLGSLNPVLIALAFCLVTVGLASGPAVFRRRVRFLTAYPFWVLNRIERLMEREWRFLPLFVLIFGLNSTSLLLNVVSGLALVPPVVFAWLLGLNLGVILARLTGGRVFIPIILNPVAWLELPAAVLSLSSGMQIGLTLSGGYGGEALRACLLWGGSIYVFLVLPLLFVAALLETYLIGLTSWVRGGTDGPVPSDENGPEPVRESDLSS